MEVLRLADDPNASLAEIARAFEADPAGAAHLLKVVNSSASGLSRRIASLQQAIGLLGMQAVKAIALSFSVMNEKPPQCVEFDHERFCSESVARAVAARAIVMHVRGFAPDEAFGFGLLSKVGRLALAAVFSEPYAHVLRDAKGSDSRTLCKLEASTFEIDHNEVGAELLRSWKLPVFYCDTVRYQDDCDNGHLEPGSRPHKLARILHWTESVWSSFLWPEAEQPSTDALVEATVELGLSSTVARETLDAIAGEWNTLGAVLSVKTRDVPKLTEAVSPVN